MEETDWSGQPGALLLARRIRDYWASRGYLVNTRIEPVDYNPTNSSAVWAIKSNLVNGVPVKAVSA